MEIIAAKRRVYPALGNTDTLRGNDSSVVPFTEKPSLNRMEENPATISAHDLFSMFTADIIKDKVVFVR